MYFKQWCAVVAAVCVTTISANLGQAATPQGSYQVQIHAAEMCCKGCVQKVSAQLYAAPGVTSVAADLESRMVTITVSQKKGASIDQLWQAVVAGKGGPTQLRTTNAVFTLTAPTDKSQNPVASTNYVVVENLNEQGRAQQIAGKLYAIRGVEKVNADAQQNTLIVSGEQLSPWALIGAVTSAQSRPLLVKGSYGEMRIEWLQNQQAYQPNHGGIQK